MSRETILVFAALAVLAAATEVKHCDTERADDSLFREVGYSVYQHGVLLESSEFYEDKNQVRISNCEVPPCKLRQNTESTIEMTFVPAEKIERMRTGVSALLFGVPLPFVGVDGTDACNDVFHSDGTRASCPLSKGVEYIYKKSFPVLSIYPKVPLIVIYQLRQGNNQIMCFQVPAAITN